MTHLEHSQNFSIEMEIFSIFSKTFMSFIYALTILSYAFMCTFDDQTALYISSKIGNNECVQLLNNIANPDIDNYYKLSHVFMVYSLYKVNI